MHVKTNNGVVERFPYTIGELRKENPNTSFPHILSNELLNSYGVFSVTEQQRPDTDRFSYCVKRQLPELIDGQWVVTWDVIQKTDEQLAEEKENQANAIRQSRNKKLSFSDWTQVADAPVDQAAWAAYRQALRDIPSQEGFPWEVTWAVEP